MDTYKKLKLFSAFIEKAPCNEVLRPKIVNLIVNGGADYVICLKGNQEILHENVKTLFENKILTKPKKELETQNMYCKTSKKDYGKIETRE